MKVGHGYDVHRLVENRKLILGGVLIDYEKGLMGHSDADVLTHAIMDSLLGAAGLDDIGTIFPDNDLNFKDANSINLLIKVKEMLDEKNIAIGNIDCTILAQSPKLRPYINQMKINISKACNIPTDDINIKATTEEGLGFTGKKEGISAHCVCIIENKLKA
ncbi:MAG: 2-C-methyl-D-erythritol 2,4-cyclodiphosphate synthase [Oscillospiraceae bacterium]